MWHFWGSFTGMKIWIVVIWVMTLVIRQVVVVSFPNSYGSMSAKRRSVDRGAKGNGEWSTWKWYPLARDSAVTLVISSSVTGLSRSF
jgi:hypothetical protein